MSRSRLRLLLACLAALAILAPLAWMWQASLMPATYSVMDMGTPDYGGGPEPAGGATGHEAMGDMDMAGMEHTETVSVADLVTTEKGTPDVAVDLVAAQGEVTLASGRTVQGYTLNGTSPGPQIEARQGDLVEVTVRNESVADGMTLHWHGLDVPNAVDGVAGVTQDAVAVGDRHTYRFVAEQAGTYWYHSHQVSHEQVIGGLFGTLVVHPADPPDDTAGGATVDAMAVSHTYSGTRTLNGQEGEVPFEAEPGQRVRVRVVNTDNAPTQVWVGGPYVVRAVDGYDLVEPTPVTDRSVTLTGGARLDIEVATPDDGSAVRLHVGGATSLVVGPEGSVAPEVAQPAEKLDLLSYGSPADLPFDVSAPDRTFDYDIGRRPGFLDGRPGLWWTVNGEMFPDVPMYVVREGDVVVMRIHNGTGEDHPMHLHGHHAVVLSRDGVAATGSPWWVDSLAVDPDETYEIAFVADNPGLWMDHCHNLPHAKEGLVAHLMYEGVDTPYRVGGDPGNEPE
jgi:FtsP/CotA-like multicopper oxidase with cupredoxin domain